MGVRVMSGVLGNEWGVRVMSGVLGNEWGLG